MNVNRSPYSDENIKFEIGETEFDISLIHKTETRIVPTDTNWIEPLMRKFTKRFNRHQNSSTLYNLSLFKTYEYLENLIKDKNDRDHDIFSQAYIVLKNWAKVKK